MWTVCGSAGRSIDGLMDGRMGGQTDAPIDGRTTDGQKWTNVLTDGRMDGRADGRADDPKDGRTV